ncbi:hypothetical protein BDN72DRAFT_91784 [Pluteus cervinus]|uniref:Uncharacterized protein n=1 Tax=Pluteus cervinus TaxID=181527 RepID=A0ACD3AQ15_9AGAR|nr:hypothetical protein BDN72DRAFT_91784 [Pluteus cervinus]
MARGCSDSFNARPHSHTLSLGAGVLCSTGTVLYIVESCNWCLHDGLHFEVCFSDFHTDFRSRQTRFSICMIRTQEYVHLIKWKKFFIGGPVVLQGLKNCNVSVTSQSIHSDRRRGSWLASNAWTKSTGQAGASARVTKNAQTSQSAQANFLHTVTVSLETYIRFVKTQVLKSWGPG